MRTHKCFSFDLKNHLQSFLLKLCTSFFVQKKILKDLIVKIIWVIFGTLKQNRFGFYKRRNLYFCRKKYTKKKFEFFFGILIPFSKKRLMSSSGYSNILLMISKSFNLEFQSSTTNKLSHKNLLPFQLSKFDCQCQIGRRIVIIWLETP